MGKTVKRVNNRNLAAVVLAGALAATLAACGADATTPAATGSAGDGASSDAATDLSGNLAGAGASSQEKAMGGWMATFTQTAPDVAVSYDAVGSGGGREQFLSGGVLFAGSDAALKPEEVTSAQERCFGGEAIELPALHQPHRGRLQPPGRRRRATSDVRRDHRQHLQRHHHLVGRPRDRRGERGRRAPGHDDHPGQPQRRVGHHRELHRVPLGGVRAVPGPTSRAATGRISGTQSGSKTSGLIDTVTGAEGAIGYADASQAGDLGTVALKVGEEYVPFSPEAAAKVVDASPRAEDATDNRLVVELDRTTTEAGAYPLVLISYSVACSQYDDDVGRRERQGLLQLHRQRRGPGRRRRPERRGLGPDLGHPPRRGPGSSRRDHRRRLTSADPQAASGANRTRPRCAQQVRAHRAPDGRRHELATPCTDHRGPRPHQLTEIPWPF